MPFLEEKSTLNIPIPTYFESYLVSRKECPAHSGACPSQEKKSPAIEAEVFHSCIVRLQCPNTGLVFRSFSSVDCERKKANLSSTKEEASNCVDAKRPSSKQRNSYPHESQQVNGKVLWSRARPRILTLFSRTKVRCQANSFSRARDGEAISAREKERGRRCLIQIR